MENVVRNWLLLMVEYQLVDQEGMGLVVGKCLGLFYTDNGVVGLWYMEWLQGALNLLIGLLRQYGPVVNV